MNILQLIGGPGAGKSAVAHALSHVWSGRATHMRTNRYLRDRQPADGPDFLMLPSSIDWPLVQLYIESLSRGQRVIMPDYNWLDGRRLPPRPAQTGSLGLDPTDLILLDSLFLAPFELESVKIFVDTPLDIRRMNIAQRDDELELGEDFVAHFDTITEPGFQKYVLPQRAACDLVLDGTWPIEQVAEYAQRHLSLLWGGWG